MDSGMSVKMPMTWTGKKKAGTKKTSPAAMQTAMVKPAVLRIWSMSRAPQNWVMKVEQPLENPNTTIE